MSGPDAHFFSVMDAFNEAFQDRFLEAFQETESDTQLAQQQQWLTADGQPLSMSYRLTVRLSCKNTSECVVQLRQGPLVISGAAVDRCCNSKKSRGPTTHALTLHTYPLSFFKVYPLHVFVNESNHFFENRGYGRLMLFFAGLRCICTNNTLKIECASATTAYILFKTLGPHALNPDDVECEDPRYLVNLMHAHSLAPMQEFTAFDAWYWDQNRTLGYPATYIIHPTEANRITFTNAIAQWTHQRVTSTTHEQFMTRFIHAPTRAQIDSDPAMQLCYPGSA